MAGEAEAVKRFCVSLAEELAAIGLTLNKGKSEVIAAAGVLVEVAQSTFEGLRWDVSGTFSL